MTDGGLSALVAELLFAVCVVVAIHSGAALAAWEWLMSINVGVI